MTIYSKSGIATLIAHHGKIQIMTPSTPTSPLTLYYQAPHLELPFPSSQKEPGRAEKTVTPRELGSLHNGANRVK